MADLFLDIRDRHIRALVSDSGHLHFQRTYDLQALKPNHQARSEHTPDGHAADLLEGELANVIATIRTDAAITIDQAHLILPSADVLYETHRLPRMPQEDALKLLTRKNLEKTGDESALISLTPMAIDQNSQEWLTEYIPTETLRTYKKELSSSKVKLKTVTTALDSTLHAITRIRESIFNAHAIFEINFSTIEVYYVSATTLLLHETLRISDEEEPHKDHETERSLKKRQFAILDRLYHVNAQFISAHSMTPLQKVWLCGTDKSIAELSSVLQDAMDVETSLLNDGNDSSFIALNGFYEAYQAGRVVNLMHTVLLSHFQLRKSSGLLIYIATALLAVFFIITAEYRHNRLKKQVIVEKKELSTLKASQTASTSFVKNLDLLRKLSGSQVIFYPIFRELAVSLPDGVYLDSFSYVNKDSRDTIEVSTTFNQPGDLGTEKTLTKLMKIMDQSPYLHQHREPSVISGIKKTQKTMTVKFTCEVDPLDTAK